MRTIFAIIISLLGVSVEAADYGFKESLHKDAPIAHPITGARILHPTPLYPGTATQSVLVERPSLGDKTLDSLINDDDEWVLFEMLFPCFMPLFNVLHSSRG